MKKSELYTKIIEIQKKTGQGLSGIVKINSSEISQNLDELISEGLVKRCYTGGSLGHPESNYFYMPTKGYNVWEDDGTDGENIRHKGRYLTFVRLYLGILPEVKSGILDVTTLECLRDPDIMLKYSEWLNRNNIALKEMLDLESFYLEENITLTEDDLKWIKERGWYKDNVVISNCLERSINNNDDEVISINKQLLSLYRTDTVKYSDKIEKSEKEIEDINKNRFIRNRVNKWLSEQKQNIKIKTALKK
jgi:hypothetical protein